MSLTDIITKILDDAHSDAKQILRDADMAMQEIGKKTRHLQETLQQEQARAMQYGADRVYRERMVLYRQKMKARLDKEKRVLLDGVFHQAAEAVRQDEKFLHEMIAQAISNLSLEGDVTVAVPKGNMDSIKHIFGKTLERARYVEDESVLSGCVILTDTAEYDLTFENVIRDRKQMLEAEVAKILFE